MTEEGSKKTASGSVTSLAGRDAGKTLVAFYDVLKKIEETEAKGIIPLLKRIEKNTAGLQKTDPTPSSKKPQAATTAKGVIPRYAPMPRAAGATKYEAETVAKVDGKRAVDKHAAKAVEPANAVESKNDKTIRQRIIADAEDGVIVEPVKIVAPGKKARATETRKVRDAAAETEEILTQEKTEPAKRAVRARRKAAVAELAESEEVKKRDASGRFVGKSKSQEAREKQRGEAEKKSVLQSLKDGLDAIPGGGGRGGGEHGALEDAAGTAAGGAFYESAIEIKDAISGAADEEGILGKIAGKLGRRRSKDEDEDDEESTAEAIAAVEKEDKKRHKELVDAVKGIEPGQSQGGQNAGGLFDRLPGGKTVKKLGKSIGGAVSGAISATGGLFAAGGKSLLGAVGRLAGPAGAIAGAGAAGYAVGTVLNKTINKVGEKITGKKGWTLGGQIYDSTHKDEDAATTFEVGSGKTRAQAAGTISTGKGDKGGKSYGSYQLASKEGEVERFLQHSGYASQFAGLQVGSKEFDAKWKGTAQNDPEFYRAQKQYAIDSKYAPQMEKLSKAGIDLSGKGKAVQDMVLSTANQYGANSSIIQKALKGKDVAAMSEADIVSAVQDFKAAGVSRNFRSSSPKVQAGVAKRIQEEKEYLLAVDRGEKRKKQTGATATAVADAQPAKQLPAEVSEKKQKAGGIPGAKAVEETPIQLAGGGPVKKPSTPERMANTVENSFAASHQRQSGATQAQGAADATNSAMLAAIEKLASTMSKMPGAGKDRTSRPDTQTIPTEFDDTMLTLMAYDRI